MVEQIARAICEADGNRWFGSDAFKGDNEPYYKRARAALRPIIAFGRRSGSHDVLTFVNEIEKGAHDG